MNKVCLIGRLTRDPEVKGEGDKKLSRYSLAVDRKVSKNAEKQTDFINCVCFGKTAEFAEKWLKKGTKVGVTGRIQTGSYEKEGQKIYTTDVIVEEHDFAESKAPTSTSASSDEDFMEIPASDFSDMPF